MHTIEQIKEKIAKLLEWKEGQEKIGMLHLAEQAAGKIAKLMMEYNLELADIPNEWKKKLSMKQYFWKFMELPSPGRYYADFGRFIARANFCDAYYTNGMTELVIYGQDFEVDIVVYLIETLLHQIRRGGLAEYRQQYNDAKRNYMEAFGRECDDATIAKQIGWINTFQRNYVIGAGQAIANRLYKDLKKEEVKNEKVTALVLVKKNQLEKFLESEGIKLQSVSSGGSRTDAGYAEGYEKGKSVNFSRGINSNGATLTKQLK